jgi:hypothetical protein
MTGPSPDPVRHAYEMRPPTERRNRIQFDQSRRIISGNNPGRATTYAP